MLSIEQITLSQIFILAVIFFQPENILCIRKNSNKIKIIDFGLAQKMTPGLQVSCGTPEFLAPEVVSYDEVSKTTDMWSVGVICYVL